MTEKIDLSTCSEDSSIVLNNNEARLVKLVKNLQLELGYHAIALRKAQQMIELLQKDNNSLKNQNAVLKNKCNQYQLKIIKCQNKISKISRKTSGSQNIECLSADLKSKPIEVPSKILQNQRMSVCSAHTSKYCHNKLFDPETVSRLTQKNTPRFFLNQISQQDGYLQKPTPSIKKVKRNSQKQPVHSPLSPLKANTPSYSFIPFDQLQFNPNYK